VAAVSELEEEYGDRVTFRVIPADETNRRQDEIASFGFTDQRHGLVIFGPEGEAVVKMPGHQFGREEIEAGLKRTLDA